MEQVSGLSMWSGWNTILKPTGFTVRTGRDLFPDCMRAKDLFCAKRHGSQLRELLRNYVVLYNIVLAHNLLQRDSLSSLIATSKSLFKVFWNLWNYSGILIFWQHFMSL